MPLMKIFLWLSVTFNLAYGCATCQLMIPSVELNVSVQTQKRQLNKIDFVWNFSDLYTQTIEAQYDKNRDDILDEEELGDILQAMLDYIKPRDMLSVIKYSEHNSTEPLQLHPNYHNFEVKIMNNLLVFTYEGLLKQNIENKGTLLLAFEDEEAFFAFIVTDLEVRSDEFDVVENLYLFTAGIEFQKKAIPAKNVPTQEPIVSVQKQVMTEESTKSTLQEGFLKQSMEKIKLLFSTIKDEKNPTTYLLLLFFAYLYGVIHALGPGHGKTLVASYFLSHDRSYFKAFLISLAIGVVHTFSAFTLTLVIYFLVNTFLAQFLDDTVFFTTKISALIIIFIALHLINKKYRFYKEMKRKVQAPKFAFSASPMHASSCGCGSCKIDKDSTDIALIISAGIIPCPGTTTLFIFAISMGLYYAGFISALVMSLGMSSVIFVSALLSTLLRNKVLKSSEKLKQYLEYISLLFILVLGGFLLLS